MAAPPSSRTTRPQRVTGRVAASAEHQNMLVTRLSSRDRWITRMVAEHRVLTTNHLLQIAFGTRRSMNERLRDLYRWRVLDRFQPLRPRGEGASPAHYVLDIAGAALLAHEDGLDPRQTGYRHDHVIGIAHSMHREHTVAVNSFFTSLIATARASGPDTTLLSWWSEARCAQAFGDLVRPDGYGRWQEGTRAVAFFVEVDRGTETLATLGSKLSGYHDLAAISGTRAPVLFWLPSQRREGGARRVLVEALRRLDAPHLVPVATAAADVETDDGPARPAGACWLPLSDRAWGAPRRALSRLALPGGNVDPARPDLPVARPNGLRAPEPMGPEPAPDLGGRFGAPDRN